jgi:hypothetical protein
LRGFALAAGASLFAFAVTSCYPRFETTCGQEQAPPVNVGGVVRDRDTGEPLAGALVIGEVCGLRSENPYPASGHPNFWASAVTDSQGHFSLLAPQGAMGLHAFLPGFQCGQLAVSGNSGPATLTLRDVGTGLEPPVLSDLEVDAMTVAPGAPLTFRVRVRSTEALSEAVILANPAQAWARGFTPPRRGSQAEGYASGTWQLSTTAPETPGRYRFVAVAADQRRCLVAREQPSVEVRVSSR